MASVPYEKEKSLDVQVNIVRIFVNKFSFF